MIGYRKTYIGLLLTTTAAIAGASAATAQDAAPVTPAAVAPVPSAPTEPRPSVSTNNGIAEIVVTAQKRSQNLQDVPIAISAISGDTLRAKGITDTAGLMGTLPSLQVTTPYGKTQPNFSLRGVSVANEFSASTASPIGVYVDEVYQSFRASHGQQLYDLDHVEVLYGPQGTLYGRNTTGGAISFFTKQPSLKGTEGYVTGGYGNYNTKTGEGAIETTIIPGELGIRASGTISRGGGWLYDPVEQRHIGTTNSMAGRLIVRFKPASNLDISLKVYGARDNPLAATPYGLGQLADGRDALGYSRFDPAQNGGAPLGKNEVAADQAGHYYTRSLGTALTVKYDISDHLNLTSITGYDIGKYRNSPFDCDGSPNDLCSIRYYASSKNFGQDLRLSYKDHRLHAVAGLYYGEDKVYTHNQPDFFGALRPLLLSAGLPSTYGNPAITTPDSIKTVPAYLLNPALTPTSAGYCAPVVVNPKGFLDARSLIALQTDIATNNSGGGGFGGAASAACRTAGAPPFSPILADQVYTIKRPSKAIYTDASYDLTDKLTFSGGLRYTWDKVEYVNGRTTVRDLGGQDIYASLIPYVFPYVANQPAVNLHQKTGRLTGRANLSYHFTPSIMGYVNYSRGYRSGSYNGLAYEGLNQVYYIQPEKVDAYEGGLKTKLFDRRVQLNVAGFYYQYQNQQFTQVIGATSFTRSGNGRLFGGEASLAVQPLPNLRIDTSFGYLNTKYTGNVIDPTNTSSATLPINGNPFPNAPKITFSASADWDVVKTDKGKLTLHADTSYMGKYYFDPFKNYGQTPCDQPAPGFNILQAGPAIACGNPGYWLVNSRLTYNTKSWSVSAWVKNLTNKYYYTYGLNINVFAVDYLNRGMPRTFGGEATFRF